MVKLIGYILCIYLLVLAVIPCCSFDNCQDDPAEEQSLHANDEDCGSCSPFFSCQSCANPAIAYSPHVIITLLITYDLLYAPHETDRLATGYRDVWQPPKLV